MNYISTKDKAQKAPHFAALIFTSVYIPGDERSRTNPGHGYPAENKSVVEYIAFDSREEMQKWVQDRETPRFGMAEKNYLIIEAKPLTVTVTAAVQVG